MTRTIFGSRRASPLGAVVRGLVAGAAGSAAIGLFFKWTQKIAPTPPKDAFTPPEKEQRKELPTETVARRFVEQLAQRGPLDDEAKKRLGELVHYGFGAGWGALYGLVRETVPGTSGLVGSLGLAAIVFAVSDLLLLPAFQLAAPANEYPIEHHGYQLAAHVPYALATTIAFGLLRPRFLALAAAAAGIAATREKLPETLSSWVRPVANAAHKVAEKTERLWH